MNRLNKENHSNTFIYGFSFIYLWSRKKQKIKRSIPRLEQNYLKCFDY